MCEIDKFLAEKELNKILEKLPDLIEYQNFYEKIKYLENLKYQEKHEDFFYEIFEPTLKLAATSSRPFSNFTA